MKRIDATEEKLSPRQIRFLEALFVENGTAQAARAAGVSRASAERWQREPGFRAVFERVRQERFEQATTRLREAAGEAVSTLLAVMRDESNPATARVSAARSALEFTSRAVEIENLERRLDELEQRLSAGIPGRRVA